MKVTVRTVIDGPWQEVVKKQYVDLAALDCHGRHVMVTDPDEADLILFVDLHQQGQDTLLQGLDQHPLVRQHPDKIRVIDVRDRPFFTFPGIYVSWTAGARGSSSVAGGCYPELLTDVPPDGGLEPDLLFSFTGARTHPIRAGVLGLQHPRALLQDSSGSSLFDVRGRQDRSALQRGFADTMRRSKFVLCPRGHGTSTYRLFEAMRAGRVPVILSDKWTAPPGIDWSSCSVRVAERDLPLLPELLERQEVRWAGLAEQALLVWQTAFSPTALWDTYIETISALPRSGVRWPSLQREVVRIRTLAALHALSTRRRPRGD